MFSRRMRSQSFSHVAITVADFNRSVRFYPELFGATLVGVSHTPKERIQGFFGVDDPDPELKIGWLRLPGGATIEIFEFTPYVPAEPTVWNRQGIHHFSVNVHDTDRWHAYLASRGVKIVAEPLTSPGPGPHTFMFIADPDGNLLELIDMKVKRPLLKLFGPAAGGIFKRTMYRKYYLPGQVTRKQAE